MGTKPGHRKVGGSLALWIFALVLAATAIVAASGSIAAYRIGTRVAEDTVSSTLTGSYSLSTLLRQQRYRHLDLVARFFATDQQLTRTLAEPAQGDDDVSVLDSLEEYQNLLGFDLGLILDPLGRVIARTDRATTTDELSDDPLIEVALDENEAFGVWRRGNNLFHAAAVPLVRQFDLVGYAVVGYAADDALALHIKRASGAEVVLLVNTPTGPIPAASTIPLTDAEDLVSELRRKGELLARIQSGETIDRVELLVRGAPHVALVTPLEDAAGGSAGIAVAMISTKRTLSGYLWVRMIITIAGAAVVLLSAPIAFWLSRRATKPLAGLAQLAENAAAGAPYEPTPPPSGKSEIARIDRALQTLLSRWSRRSALQRLVSRTSRDLPEPAVGSASTEQPSIATSATLIAIEMTRFRSSKIAYDADENVDRFRRDVRRIAALARHHGGRLSSVSGHRAVVVVDERTGPFAALKIAAAALHLLSQRENVFDEPSPPAVALTHGPTVIGALESRGSLATLGIPTQQLDSLMREATPGEIYMTRNLHQLLAEQLSAEGVAAREQRGLLSPQPLFVLSPDEAGEATGLTEDESPTHLGFDYEPGSLLGDRFEILAQLAGRDWFKARDRQRNDPVSLKLLADEMVADPQKFERLRDTMLQARLIDHPNVLQVLDFGEEDSVPYVSFEFKRASTLRFMLERISPFPTLAALDIGIQLANGLDAIHRADLIHGRISPDLAVVGNDATVCWAEVGLVLGSGDGEDPRYQSAARLSGERITRGDDVYSLGAILYELFCGQPPFDGATKREVFEQITVSDPPDPGQLGIEVPPSVVRTILGCLSRAPADRPSASTLSEQLLAVATASGER